MTDLDSSTERLVRMRETWRGGAPGATEISAARRRFFDRRSARRPRRWSAGLVVAALFAAGTALASARALSHFARTSGSARHPPAARAVLGSGEGASPLPPPSPFPVPAVAPSAAAPWPIDAPAQRPSEAPLENLGGAATARAAPSRRPDRPQSPSTSWAAAAEAMRKGDLGAAERAFTDLARGADPTTRDQASLSLAEVMLAEGRVDEARPLLERLMAHGSTPFVRKRAARALGAKDGSSAPEEPGTNSP